ncbi:hypothetical protein AZI11_08315 [Levilactobacillus brevis]|nr:hypothetical protein AZI11_08315 [Levilactobacillus brevis]ARN95548.1 hypothetical protein AZI12_08365 [Levilactobacillus brevis]
MFNYSNKVKWIRVVDIDGVLTWINLEKVERIYQTSEGSTFESAYTITQTTIPFEKISDLLNGNSQ